jgi:hypothetical protein
MSGAERGLETVVSHVLSLGITTLLIVGLVASAGGFLDAQRSTAAQTEVETVANRLANGLMQADSLATNSESVTVTVRLQERVAGSTYTARLRQPSACPPPTGSCLTVSVAEYDAQASVTVLNETWLSLESGADGRFEISSNGSSGEAEPDRRRVEMSPRIGIGGDIAAAGAGSAVSIAQSPVPRYGIRPDVPQTGEGVVLDAGESRDPDGNIVKYEWDTNGDGSFDITTTSATTVHSFGSPGLRNVTLRVTDDSGLTANETKRIQVSGLLFSPPFQRAPTPGVHGLTFTVTNQYSDPVKITRLLFDPDNPSQNQLLEQRATGQPNILDTGYPPHEFEWDIGDDGSIDYHEDRHVSNPFDVPRDGLVHYLGGHPTSGHVELDPSEKLRITIQGTPTPMVNERATVGLRYRIRDGYGRNVFNSTVVP